MRDDRELLHGNPADIADYLGVDVRTVNRWRNGSVPLPVPCRKLLALRFDGDASALLGKDWEGFYFGRDGEFYMPCWKYGFNPHQIRAMFWQVQQVEALQIELLNLRRTYNDLINNTLYKQFLDRLTRIRANAEHVPDLINLN